MQDRLGAPLVGCAGHLAAEDVVLEERHRAGVLHGARVELGHEQLVVLAERVRDAEVLVVEVEALLGLGEQPLGVHVLGQRRAAEDAERDVAVLVGVDVVPARVRPGDQRREVGAHPRGGGEGVHRRPSTAHAVGAVGDDLPVRRRGHRDVEGGLQVGLVEAGEHPLGVGRLELRVQVDLVVDRVDEAVQALAGVGVAAVGVDHEHVVLGQAGQRDAGGLVVAGDVESTPLRVALRTVSAAMSMTVSAPASASNVTVVVDRNVRSPGAPLPSVRSSSMR